MSMANVNQVLDIDHGYKKFLEEVKQLNQGAEVYVGIRATKGSEKVSDDFDLVDLSIALEFGTDTIPERSHLRATIDENRKTYLDELETGTLKVLLQLQEPIPMLSRLGARIVADIKKKIRGKIPPPNAPSTIKQKNGKSTPLINTARYINSIDYEVKT